MVPFWQGLKILTSTFCLHCINANTDRRIYFFI